MDGVCGINVEHSASEGVTVVRYQEEFLEYLKSNPYNTSSVNERKNSIKSISENNNKSLSNENVTRLQWDVDDLLSKCILDSTKRINKLVIYFSNESENSFPTEDSLSPIHLLSPTDNYLHPHPS